MRRQHRPIGHRHSLTIAAVVALSWAALLHPVAAQDEGRLTIPLNENENSGVSGTATLAADGENTRVSLEMSGDPLTGDHPSHIHTGTCADFDPDPLYPLTTVLLDEVSDEGESDTTVEGVALDDLLDDDHVILVHPSAEELYPEWVCGDIEAGAGGGDGQSGADAGTGGAGGINRMPNSGVGSAAEGTNAPLPAFLGALAVLAAAAAGGLSLRRR
jgi:hypothetical protein